MKNIKRYYDKIRKGRNNYFVEEKEGGYILTFNPEKSIDMFSFSWVDLVPIGVMHFPNESEVEGLVKRLNLAEVTREEVLELIREEEFD